MFTFIEFLKKRPADRTILLGRIAFGTTIALLLGLNFTTLSLHLPASIEMYEVSVKYALFVLAIVPVFMGATNICLAKRNRLRLIQIIFGISLFLVGNALIALPVQTVEKSTTTPQSGSLDYAQIGAEKTVSHPVNVGFWIAFLGILPLLAGITGKCITSKCIKYGEVIKKIRV